MNMLVPPSVSIYLCSDEYGTGKKVFRSTAPTSGSHPRRIYRPGWLYGYIRRCA
jgi:hypothetical protein